MIGDSPHQHRNPVDCLLASSATMRTCCARASLAELQTDASVAAAAAKHGVGFIKVTGWFCARASRVAVLCPLVVNRTISWIDLGHISETYGSSSRCRSGTPSGASCSGERRQPL